MKFNLPPKNLRFFFAGSLAFLIFIVLTILVFTGFFIRFDFGTTVYLQSLISRSLDTPLSLLSLLGNIEPTTILVGLIGLWIYRHEKRIYYPLILFITIMFFEMIGKFFLYHPGPPAEFFRFNPPFNIPRIFVKTSFSFPSGHVSRTAFLIVLGIFLGRKKPLVIISFALYLCLMMISRVYLGEHWASDVLGGLFLGGSMGLLALVYF